jgi:hypothetical protein
MLGAKAKKQVYDLVRNPVTDLVGMAFGDAFTGEKVIGAGHRHPFRGLE